MYPRRLRHLLSITLFIFFTVSHIHASAACQTPSMPPQEDLTETQLKQLQTLANQGNAQALYRLSLRMPRHDTRLSGYATGCGVNNEWIKTLTLAAHKGYAPAQYDLAMMLINRENIGYGPDSLYQIRYASSNSNYQRDDIAAEGLPWLEKAAQQSYAPSYYALGIYYARRDPDWALAWLRKSATSGNQEAITRLEEIRTGLIKLSYWYDNQATQNWLIQQIQTNATNIEPVQAMYQASQYDSSPNSPSLETLYWLYKAAALGHPEAQSTLARYNPLLQCQQRIRYINHIVKPDENCIESLGALGSVIKNEELIIQIHQHRSAADQSSRTKLELAYYLEKMPQQEYKVEAIQIYRQLVRQNEPEAMYRLGVSYDIGNGVEQDSALALHWYRMAVMTMKNPYIDGFPPLSFRTNESIVGQNGYIRIYPDAQPIQRLNQISLFFLLKGQYNKNVIEWLAYTNNKSIIAGNLYPKCTQRQNAYACEINMLLNGPPEFLLAYFELAQMYLKGHPELAQDDSKAIYYLLKSRNLAYSRTLLIQLYQQGRVHNPDAKRIIASLLED